MFENLLHGWGNETDRMEAAGQFSLVTENELDDMFKKHLAQALRELADGGPHDLYKLAYELENTESL